MSESSMRKHLPNIITLLNLFCGCCAIACIFYGQFLQAFGFIFVGGLADYSDGMVARWLEVNSPFGKELDSLADMVTFGVVPGAILYMLLVLRLEEAIYDYPDNMTFLRNSGLNLMALPAFIVSTFAALRLAKFNLDIRQSEDFIGLNTPACTCFMVGLMLTFHFDSYGLRPLVSNLVFLLALIPILSFLLVSEIPMISFKFKKFKWKGNERQFSIILLSFLLLGIFRELGFSLMIVAYVGLSIFDYIFKTRKRIKRQRITGEE